MTMIGDKYLLEVESIYTDVNNPNKRLYKMKGFNSLVFDENGIEKLEEYYKTREEYTRIYEIGYRSALADIQKDISSKRWVVKVDE